MATKIKPPDDFDDAEQFLSHIRKELDLDLKADRINRDAAAEDSRFFIGDQWPTWVKALRDAGQKPVMTENYLQALVAQVTGNRRLNEASIKVLPDNGGTRELAEIREGLIRNIQKVSRAEIAYDKALENSAICGIGQFQLTLKFADSDVFEQDIFIEALPNPLCVVWDRMCQDPSGRDADHCTVIDNVDKDIFKAQYPDAQPADITVDTALIGELQSQGWLTIDAVRKANYWRMRSQKKTLALFTDGSVQDVTGKDIAEYADKIVQRSDGSPVMREADCKYAELYVVSGTDLLEGPFRYYIDRVPVFRVPGWEVNVGVERHRWGIVRPLKDSQRNHNYWRSIVAEKLMMTPKARWVAGQTAIQGREKEWREAHRSNDAVLIYNDDAGTAPVLTPPAQLEQALVLESNTSIQAMRDISNIHEASLGIQSNEVSGKAIVARQRVGELGSVIYQDNLNAAIEECGRVCNQLIPYVYDTPRIVKVLGPDDKAELVAVNKLDGTNDLSLGKYSVTITTGPSFVTKRVEAAESMLNFVNAAPQTMALVADLIAEAQDWPMATEFARRLRQALPPGAVPQEDMTPEQQQQAQASSQVQQQTAAMAQQMAVVQLREATAKAAEAEARVELIKAQTAKTQAEPRIKAASEHAKAVHTQLQDHLDVINTAEPPHPKEQPNGQ